MSNANLYTLLGKMGIEADYSGTIDPHDLMRRTLRLLNTEDRGTPDTVDRTPGGAVMIDCGLRPGYFMDSGLRLAEIADYAIEHEANEHWA